MELYVASFLESNVARETNSERLVHGKPWPQASMKNEV